MSDARQTDHFILRIKAATRDLVSLCGGVVRAGEISAKSKSEVSRWQSAAAPDVIDLPAALALERDCGVPLVTTVMAETHGRRLTDEVAAQSAASVLHHHSEVMRCAAETMAHMAAALADHTITPAEAEIVDRSVAETEVAMRGLRAALAVVRSTGPAAAAAPLSVVR